MFLLAKKKKKHFQDFSVREMSLRATERKRMKMELGSPDENPSGTYFTYT